MPLRFARRVMLALGVRFSPCESSAIPDGMKVSEVLKLLRKDGWSEVPSRGGHRQFKHPTKPGRITVSGKLSDDLPPGTLGSIPNQASLKE